MKQVISTERIPMFLWLDDLDKKTLEQLKNVANLPFSFHHVAEMPDGHLGYGMPIGGVLATDGVVIPNAVGKDVGCGMGAMHSNHQGVLSKELRKELMGAIRERIPMGYGNNRKEPWLHNSLPSIPHNANMPVIKSVPEESLQKQLATLGAGNHFIEIQQDQFGFIWVMVHSGSRNIGNRVATYHDKIAKKLNAIWHTSVPAKHDLAFLPIRTTEAREYILEMNWCVEFAKLNRQIMLTIINDVFQDIFPINFYEQFDVAHNYARFENHYGKNVIVHRKGATAARLDEIVIIPGDQGSNSFIGYGKGVRESFNSCSHGAGRTMSRTKAKKKLNLEAEIKAMDDKGIIHGMRNVSDLDEATGAYKDIWEVMRNQEDLVSVRYELSPKAVMKG